MKKPNSKYKLLVLFNESKTATAALNNAVNLAKTIDGAIDILHVKPATCVTNNSNQLAIMRTISDTTRNAKKKMAKLVSTIAKDTSIEISHNFTIGHIVTEIQDHINQTQPDIVVIGKRKAKTLGFLGDGVTKHLLKHHKGELLISGEETLTSFKDVSLGFLDNAVLKNKVSIAEDLKQKTSKPIKLFKTSSNSETSKTATNQPNTIVFEFDKASEISSSISNYVSKNKINLLCMERNINRSLDQINTQIIKTKVPVLVLAN
jgi:nucleotide-binding universal stress UspA family protein